MGSCLFVRSSVSLSLACGGVEDCFGYERDVYAFERPSRCAATMEENFDVEDDYIIIYFLHRIDLLLLIIIIIIRS